MKIEKINRNFYFFPILLIVLSFPFTYFGWMLFSLLFKYKTHPPVINFLMYVFLWPSLLLDSIGIMVTDHSCGFIPNAIGWGLIGIGISIVKKFVEKNIGGH
jgi:hypothetical protein